LRKLLPDLTEDDLQGLPDEEINKSQILDMVCAMRSFKNADDDNAEEWLQSDMYELGFQHTDSVNAAAKQKGEEKLKGRMRVKKREKVVSVSHSMTPQCVDTLLDYMGQRGSEYSDITATRRIHTAIRRRLNSSQKQVTTANYSQNKCQLCKKE
jgi:hypothetical protein